MIFLFGVPPGHLAGELFNYQILQLRFQWLNTRSSTTEKPKYIDWANWLHQYQYQQLVYFLLPKRRKYEPPTKGWRFVLLE